jgi:hypothetical protein
MRPDSEHSPQTVEQRPSPDPTPCSTTVATLLPAQAPGRLTRKARRYRPQIVKLRAEGHTLEAIREALAAVGVPVSISTVRREAVHPSSVTPWPMPPPIASLGAGSDPSAPAPSSLGVQPSGVASPAIRGLPDTSNGKDVAAAYAHSKSSNPLTRAKERS